MVFRFKVANVQNVHHQHQTERRGRAVNISVSYSGRPGFESRSRQPAVLTQGFCAFPQSLLANASIVPSIRPRPFPTKSFLIHHHSLTTISSTVYCIVTEKASQNKLPIYQRKIPNSFLQSLCTSVTFSVFQ
jgi:hypothetical protein